MGWKSTLFYKLYLLKRKTRDSKNSKCHSVSKQCNKGLIKDELKSDDTEDVIGGVPLFISECKNPAFYTK